MELCLSDNKVAFTGKLAGMQRKEAFDLVRRAGGEPSVTVSLSTSILVVGMAGWPLLPDGLISRKLRRAEELQTRGHNIEIVSEKAFLERLGIISPREKLPETCTIEDAGRILGLDAVTIRRCRHFGLIHGSGDSLDFQDLVSLRSITDLIVKGFAPESIARGLSRLEKILPDIERPLVQARLIVGQGGEFLAELRGAKIDASGQLLFDFDAESHPPASSVRLEKKKDHGDVWEWFDHALACESDGRLDEAEQAYKKALDIEEMPEAHHNLGNVYISMGDIEQAERHFRVTVEMDPKFAPAWYNLGFVLGDLGRYEEAVVALSRAIEIEHDFADCFFNLALYYEELGEKDKAANCWQEYLKFDQKGEWADIALEHLHHK